MHSTCTFCVCVRGGLLAVALAACCTLPLHAGARSKAVRELAQWLIGKSAREATEEGVERMASRISDLAARYGDDVLEACRKAGPSAPELIENAGEHAPVAVRLLARHGDEAAPLVRRSQTLALVAQHGDDAALAVLKHGELAERLVAKHGKAAAQSLCRLDRRQMRRLAMLDQDGDLARIGRTPELLKVIEQWGNRGLDFVWHNKEKLCIAAVLAAFLADPGPFIEGTRDLAEIGIEKFAAPVASKLIDEAGDVAAESARQSPLAWLAALAAALAIAGLLFAAVWRAFPRRVFAWLSAIRAASARRAVSAANPAEERV